MVPRDLFDRMAILALVAIILFCSLFVRAFATETEEYLDSGPIIEVPGEGDELPGQAEASSVLLSEIAAIRRSLEIILYFVILGIVKSSAKKNGRKFQQEISRKGTCEVCDLAYG